MKRLILLTLFVAACGSKEIESKPAAEVGAVQTPAAAEATAAPVEAPPSPGEVRLALGPESKVEWLGAKITKTHRGSFGDVSGSLGWQDGKPTSLRVEIGVDSITTDSERLIGHLKSPDFFFVEQFPKASFVASKFEEQDGSWKISGDLEMRGVSRPIAFDAKFEDGADRVVGASAFRINRQDWGVAFKGKPDDLIADEVALELQLVFPKG